MPIDVRALEAMSFDDMLVLEAALEKKIEERKAQERSDILARLEADAAKLGMTPAELVVGRKRRRRQKTETPA